MKVDMKPTKYFLFCLGMLMVYGCDGFFSETTSSAPRKFSERSMEYRGDFCADTSEYLGQLLLASVDRGDIDCFSALVLRNKNVLRDERAVSVLVEILKSNDVEKPYVGLQNRGVLVRAIQVAFFGKPPTHSDVGVIWNRYSKIILDAFAENSALSAEAAMVIGHMRRDSDVRLFELNFLSANDDLKDAILLGLARTCSDASVAAWRRLKGENRLWFDGKKDVVRKYAEVCQYMT